MLLSWLLTLRALRYALTHNVVDMPNRRSLHVQPMARGGGVAIAIAVCTGLLIGAITHTVSRNYTLAVLIGGAMIAVVGWLDDLKSGISPVIRLCVHFLAAILAVYFLGGLPALTIGSDSAHLGAVGSVVAVFGIVWSINLYNFMDGIDGIAAGEGLTVAGIAVVLLMVRGDAAFAAVGAIMAGAAGGFLLLNWAPARIFMGDVGSGFLGFLFAVTAIATEHRGSLPLLIWIVLCSTFIVDATITLIRRVLRREPFYTAHRSHAYQRMVAAGYTHASVTTAVMVVNLLLGGLAGIWLFSDDALLLTVGAAFALLGVAYLVVEKVHPMKLVPRGDPEHDIGVLER